MNARQALKILKRDGTLHGPELAPNTLQPAALNCPIAKAAQKFTVRAQSKRAGEALLAPSYALEPLP